MRPRFTAEQLKELRTLEVYPEQITQLEAVLQSISWRFAPPPRMQDVRDKLTDLGKALARVERFYERMSKPASPANGEALNRLYLAQEALGYQNVDTLHDFLEAATDIINRTLTDLVETRRSGRRGSKDFVGLILKALRLGHVEHFDCAGTGSAPSSQPMPPFVIRVARKAKPFPHIARIVSEASGGWSSDEAIKAYLKTQGGK